MNNNKHWNDLSVVEKRSFFNPSSEDNKVEKVELSQLDNKLTSITDLITKLQIIQKDISIKVEELHSVQTGKYLTSKPKQLTKKQKEQLRVDELLRNHSRYMLNPKS